MSASTHHRLPQGHVRLQNVNRVGGGGAYAYIPANVARPLRQGDPDQVYRVELTDEGILLRPVTIIPRGNQEIEPPAWITGAQLP